MAKLAILRTAVAPGGDVYSLQAGGRIVRHGNPKKNDSHVEIVYVAGERLDALWVSRTSALHAVGKRYHTNASGTWRKEKVAGSKLLALWGTSDEELWAGDIAGAVLARTATGWEPVDVGLFDDDKLIYAIHGTSSKSMYVAGDDAVAHFDGTAWAAVEVPDGCCYLDVLALSPERVIVVGRDGPNYFEGAGIALKRIGGISAETDEDFYAVAARGDDIYIATGARLLVWDGKQGRDAIPAIAGDYLSCLSVSSNGDVVAAGCIDGVHVLDGERWTVLPGLPSA